jgi:predicted phosphodiesterase
MVVWATACSAAPSLKFRADGTFRIVQFSDTQDDENLDPRTLAAMERVLDTQKPDLVVITGDCVDTGQCANVAELKQAIKAIAQPMESRAIPWAVVFGNHDHDNLGGIGISEQAMLAIYMSYPHNVNRQSPRGVNGAGNSDLLIKGSASDKPAFGVWLLDSNAYAPGEVGGQKLGGYDWIRFSQVKWYWDTSERLEKRYGAKVMADRLLLGVGRVHARIADGHAFLQQRRDVRNGQVIRFIGHWDEVQAHPALHLHQPGLRAVAVEVGDAVDEVPPVVGYVLIRLHRG